MPRHAGRAVAMKALDEVDWRAGDGVVMALLSLLVAWLVVDSVVFPADMRMDNLQYLAMAAHPAAVFEVPGIYAQRFLPSLAVWLLDRVTDCGLVNGFRTVSSLALFAFVLPLYAASRALGLLAILPGAGSRPRSLLQGEDRSASLPL